MSDDEAYRRYVLINLPHARTIVQRIARNLEVLGAFREDENGGALALHAAFDAVEKQVRPYDEDPAFEEAIRAADAIAALARELVAAILATPFRGDRLGQSIRNLFECLGLREEGARVSLECGERPDSLLR
jgi:hypothetical protein